MTKALISPEQPVETGYYVVDVAQDSFEVAAPLFWADCNDDVTAYEYWYDPSDETIKAIPETAPASQPISRGAQTL
jgi:hypothetical protein